MKLNTGVVNIMSTDDLGTLQWNKRKYRVSQNLMTHFRHSKEKKYLR